MGYTENDAERDAFYDQISEELFPEHRDIAIEQFIEGKMQSYFLQNPKIIQAPMECYNHGNKLIEVSPRCALVMYATAIELYLKSVLLKPVLFGMIHNENIASLIVEATITQSGFSRYEKLLRALCLRSAKIDLSSIIGMQNRPILVEAGEVQAIRNKVVHQGYIVCTEEFKKAKNIAGLMLIEVVEPVLNNLNLVITSDESGFSIVKA